MIILVYGSPVLFLNDIVIVALSWLRLVYVSLLWTLQRMEYVAVLGQLRFVDTFVVEG